MERVWLYKKLYYWYNNLSKRLRDSLLISLSTMGVVSTILSIIGFSLADLKSLNIFGRVIIVIALFLGICLIAYLTIGKIFKESVCFEIRNTPVSIMSGDIFDTPGLRVIGCDTHFDTRVDDVIISKNSLHGQLVLEHGDKDEIDALVAEEASRRKIHKNKDGLYNFPIGTIIKYNSSVDQNTYLLLAVAELDSQRKARTDMANFEHMLIKMWKEIDRVYSLNDVVLPILGTGILRFDDGPKHNEDLLRCMICTRNSSAVTLKAKVKILIYGNGNDYSLYEYKGIFHTVLRR